MYLYINTWWAHTSILDSYNYYTVMQLKLFAALLQLAQNCFIGFNR